MVSSFRYGHDYRICDR